MRNKENINLKASERSELEKFSSQGVHKVRLVNRAKIILLLDISLSGKGMGQEAIAEKVGVSRKTVAMAKKEYLKAKSVGDFLQRKKRETPPVTPKITGEVEAYILAMACGPVPQGYARWPLRLLAEKCVEMHYCQSISHTSVGTLLKKHALNHI